MYASEPQTEEWLGWLWLLGGVVFSVAASVPQKWSYGFTNMPMGVLGFALSACAIVCWTMTLRYLPLGASYLVWEGLGSCAALVVSAMVFHEELTWSMLVFAGMILAGCIGLHLSTKH